MLLLRLTPSHSETDTFPLRLEGETVSVGLVSPRKELGEGVIRYVHVTKNLHQIHMVRLVGIVGKDIILECVLGLNMVLEECINEDKVSAPASAATSSTSSMATSSWCGTKSSWVVRCKT